MDEYWKRSGQIPAFGNWDFANDLPITQYFESARQAGLIRYSSSSGESSTDPPRDLYSVDFKRNNAPSSTLRKATRKNRERRCPHVMVKDNKETTTTANMIIRKQQQQQQQQGKVYDVPSRKQQLHLYDAVPQPRSSSAPKPVDEDLYKIPPELLRTTKRKKMLGFISKCLVPAACVS